MFENYLALLSNDGNLAQLPVNHIASLTFLNDFLKQDAIEPDYLKEKCEVFGDHLLYIFYGRPAFRLNDDKAFPMCFVFRKPDGMPEKSFPFDSGAFFHGRMSSYFDGTVKIDDFQFEGNSDNIEKIVQNFFLNNGGYYEEAALKHVTLENSYTSVEKYVEMVCAASNDSLDGRKSAIELIYKCPFYLNDGALLLIVVPDADVKIDGTKVDFDDLVATFKNKWNNVEVMTYMPDSGHPSSSYEEIKSLVKEFLNGKL